MILGLAGEICPILGSHLHGLRFLKFKIYESLPVFWNESLKKKLFYSAFTLKYQTSFSTKCIKGWRKNKRLKLQIKLARANFKLNWVNIMLEISENPLNPFHPCSHPASAGQKTCGYCGATKLQVGKVYL